MKGHLYILDARGEPVTESDVIKWAQWFEKAERHVGNDWIGEQRVSTVFLGLDHSFHEGIPILWETMVFNGPLNFYQRRCGGSREQAEAMHKEVCAYVAQQTNHPSQPQ